MNPAQAHDSPHAHGEIATLIEQIRTAELRLSELTAGEVDTVTDQAGRTFVLAHARDELRNSEAAKQAAVFNALPARVALLDSAGVILSVNEAWRHFSGGNAFPGPHFGVGSNYVEACDSVVGERQDSARKVSAGIRSVLSGENKSFSAEYPSPLGAVPRWFQMSVTPMAEAQLTGAVVTHVDITQRVESDKAMRASEARFRGTFEQAAVGIAHVSLDGAFLRINDKLCAILGYEREELLGRTFAEFAVTKERVGNEETRRLLVTGELPSLATERRYRRKNGDLIWANIVVTMQRGAAGEPKYFISVLQDITEQRKGDEALRESEKRFRALFDHSAVGVAQVEATTRTYVRINQRFCDMVGRTPEEMVLLTSDAITHPEDHSRMQGLRQALLSDAAREFTAETRFVKPDGTVVWANVTVSTMWAPGEPADFFTVVAQDVTARKKLEEQFRQAQKMDAIGTLAGGIAHDFNNILASIQGFTELARMKLSADSDPHRFLGSVLQASRRAATLVRQILTFSRQQPLERIPIRLDPVILETMELLRATIPATVAFDLALATDAPVVLADATQLHQIIMNLGTNAWHAMRRGGRLSVSLEAYVIDAEGARNQPRLRPGNYARVTIRDTGTGMDDATLRKIFEPFFTTKLPGEGTGLGLAMVHGIMDTHDGAVTVSSRPNVGTEFSLFFPEHIGRPLETANLTDPTPRGHGERILYVDDEEVLVQLGSKVLTSLGYEPEVATDPAAALALIAADPNRFALVLTDLTMPKLTGPNLAAAIWAICPDLPIILVTGYSAALTPERVRSLGFCRLLLKPCGYHEMGLAVHAALGMPAPIPSGS